MERFGNEPGGAVVDALRDVANGMGVTPAQVALAWLLARSGVVSAIFGARSTAQLDDNLHAAEITLSDDAMTRLTEVSEPELVYPYTMFSRVQGAW